MDDKTEQFKLIMRKNIFDQTGLNPKILHRINYESIMILINKHCMYFSPVFAVWASEHKSMFLIQFSLK